MSDKITALFYSAKLPQATLFSMASGRIALAEVDVVEFTEADTSEVERDLAVPFLPDMDEVLVDKAQLVLRAQPKELDADGYAVKSQKGSPNGGFVLSLAKQGRLRKVVINYPTFPSNVTADPRSLRYHGIKTRAEGVVAQLHLVVRAATREGAGFTFGPPIFADPPLPAPGKLYGPVLVGLVVRDLGNAIEITLPNLMGTDWLFQLAEGEEPSKLSPIDFDATVTRVAIDAAPLNVSLSIPSADGDIALWSHPDYLLPDLGAQEVNFTPIAQNHLAARLKTTTAGTPTLPVPFVFRSEAEGALEIISKTLAARYVVRPLGAEGQTFRLGGSWVKLGLSAPAGRKPASGSARLVAHHLGRELNGGSPLAPPGRPTRGLRVNAGRWAARSLPVLAGDAPSLSLASVRIMLEAPDAAEAVVELRADVAGSPGRILAGPLVKQLEKGFSDWLEFELESRFAPGDESQLWVCLRSNKGDLLWFASGEAGGAKVSGDKGQTWGEIDPQLAPAAAPLAQLFHVTAESPPVPAVSLRLGEAVVSENILSGAARTSPQEFTLDEFTLPEAVRAALLTAGGTGRASVELKLFSRAVLDLSVERLTLFYNPFQS